MQELTKAEEQVMKVLWEMEKAFVKDLIPKLPLNPKTNKSYNVNTISTIVRILEEKGFVGHKAYGKTHEYFPLIPKKEYSNFYMKNFISGYFGGSFQKMVSFFVSENNVNLEDFEELMKQLEDGSEKAEDRSEE